MIGYKVFNSDWTCRGFQYEVGKVFEHNGNIEMCGAGFHFCQKASDCFNYYDFDSKNKVAEVEAIGLVETQGNKSVTDKLKIVREISWQEVLTIVNTGKDCTGLDNSGDRNSGDCNSGNWNSGDCNSGDRNSGDRNSGDCNSGNWNSGNCNSGYCNSGYWNSGDCNSGNNSSNVFSTVQENIKIFDKESNLTLRDWRNSKAYSIIRWNFDNNVWIYERNMSEKEKEENPSYKTTGGYLKEFGYKEAWTNMWNNSLSKDEKKEIMSIPNFDKDKFEFITGIDIKEELR